MTSQRDQTMGLTASDDKTDEPIIVERHDEILGGRPAVSTPVDDGAVHDHAGHSATADAGLAADDASADETASDELIGRRPAPEMGSPGPAPLVVPPGPAPAGESITGSPDGMTEAGTRTADLADPVGSPADPAGGPAEPGPMDRPAGDPAAPGWAAPTSGAATGAAEIVPDPEPRTEDPGAVDSGPADTGPMVTGPMVTGPVGADTVERGIPATPGGEPDGGHREDATPAAALAGQQWPAIQAMFVDDPKGSVERAAAAADEAAKAFVASLQREQGALRASWENDTTTEDLRTALQQYRAFCGRLEGLA